MNEKNQLRNRLIKMRYLLSSEDVVEKSHAITTLIRQLDAWKRGGRVHIYQSNPMRKEVSTMELIRWLKHDLNREVDVVADSSSASMSRKNYNVVIVPVVGFDALNQRIGLGGGWYDRFLRTQPQATTIGLAYELSSVNTIFAETHDVPLDYIVTEMHISRRG